eukprot:scaffold10421_cov76-Phaeocystis_antarctica.AAC.2
MGEAAGCGARPHGRRSFIPPGRGVGTLYIPEPELRRSARAYTSCRGHALTDALQPGNTGLQTMACTNKARDDACDN